jgi:hypothetical protein
MERTGARLLEPEAHRMKGELLLADQRSLADSAHLSKQIAAEASFRRAIDIARQQGARWWELRATVSLCRLLEETCAPHDPHRAEARQMLAETSTAGSARGSTPSTCARRGNCWSN